MNAKKYLNAAVFFKLGTQNQTQNLSVSVFLSEDFFDWKQMEVMVAAPLADFNFESSACSTPCMTAPPSPRGFGDLFFSAPTSPTRASAMYREFNRNFINGASDDPELIDTDTHLAQHEDEDEDEDGDFDFEFSGPLDRTQISLSAAEDLFHGGQIRTLDLKLGSPVSPPRKVRPLNASGDEIDHTRRERGRERSISLYASSDSSRRGSRATRSLSPLRVCSEFHHIEEKSISNSKSPNSSDSRSSSNSSKWCRSKWRLKNFLLFRSASEGRATEKDPLRKYTAALWKKGEDLKNSSFRSIESVGSSSTPTSSSRRSKGRVSAHELHYTANRAVAEELKKKTYLPYKRGLLGCLAFNPTVNELARGF
ncbi:hypothetical protein Sjap_017197 [Stephania japonica]|uniref:Uncharacterized protein n=1 Tax=Stephania japonica TaxID=461633 RepID=A0AAP0I5R0_9MAGN